MTSPPSLSVRRARTTDAHIIAKFNRALARETENRRLSPAKTLAGARSLIAKPAYGFYLLAERKEQVIGQLCVTYEWSDWNDGVYWWIQSVYVRSDCRGQGVFRALFDEVRRLMARDRSSAGLRLYTHVTNRRAQGLYRRLGMAKAPYLMYEMD